MKTAALKIVVVTTPIGFVGSGKGGGVELTLVSLIQGLKSLGHEITLVAPKGSILPEDCSAIEIKEVDGKDQPSWQHQEKNSPVKIPLNGVLPKLWETAIEMGKEADAILNLSYDWLPIWISQFLDQEIFHLVSMGNVSEVMKNLIKDVSKLDSRKFAFHTYRQASDFYLDSKPIVVGNGFEMKNYHFQSDGDGPIGWAGRIAPEKGLEDAAAVASTLGERLLVWGLIEDDEYAASVQNLFPNGIIEFRGFLRTSLFQKELGFCRALINTPKWNEAYGNVVVEAMACGVPVVAYDRGGPGELITPGINGWLVPPDDVKAMVKAVKNVELINRKDCRDWVKKCASKEVFAKRIESWILSNISCK